MSPEVTRVRWSDDQPDARAAWDAGGHTELVRVHCRACEDKRGAPVLATVVRTPGGRLLWHADVYLRASIQDRETPAPRIGGRRLPGVERDDSIFLEHAPAYLSVACKKHESVQRVSRDSMIEAAKRATNKRVQRIGV